MLLWLLALSPWAVAAEIQAPDPLEFANLPAAQQDVIRESVHRQMMAATPEERMRFRVTTRLAIEKMTQDERRRLTEQTQLRWSQLSPRQQQLIEDRKREILGVMTREELHQAQEQRKQLFQMLPCCEQKQLEKPLPSR